MSDENHALLVALCHPLRRQILRAMPEAAGHSITPRELADLLEESLTHVSYHTRVLARCRTAKLVRVEPMKGPFERHYYRRRVKQPWARLLIAELGSESPGKAS